MSAKSSGDAVVTVHELMTPDPIVVNESAPLDVCVRLLEEHEISGMPVVDSDGVLVGVISETDVVRARVIDGVVSLLDAGRSLTFKDVALEAGVPERTVYRYFPTRAALLAAVFEWTNEQIGYRGPRPTTQDQLVALVRQAFRGFDGHAPVVRQMLIEPDGRGARLADVAERRRAAIELVRHEVPGLDRSTRERVAAAIQVMNIK